MYLYMSAWPSVYIHTYNVYTGACLNLYLHIHRGLSESIIIISGLFISLYRYTTMYRKQSFCGNHWIKLFKNDNL